MTASPEAERRLETVRRGSTAANLIKGALRWPGEPRVWPRLAACPGRPAGRGLRSSRRPHVGPRLPLPADPHRPTTHNPSFSELPGKEHWLRLASFGDATSHQDAEGDRQGVSDGGLPELVSLSSCILDAQTREMRGQR